MATIEQITEIVQKLTQLENEQVLLRDLFARAAAAHSTGGGAASGRLNFREAERHMPREYDGKNINWTELCFRIESYMTTIDPNGEGGEIAKRVAQSDVDVDDTVIADLEMEFWHVKPLNAALASCLITCTTGEVATLVRRILRAEPGAGFQTWQELSRWFRPKSTLEGPASMARIIEPAKCKTIADLQRAVMDWELKVVEHEGRFGEQVPETVKVAALKRMLTNEMAERYVEGPNTYIELRSKIATYIGEKLAQSAQGRSRWTLESATTTSTR